MESGANNEIVEESKDSGATSGQANDDGFEEPQTNDASDK